MERDAASSAAAVSGRRESPAVFEMHCYQDLQIVPFYMPLSDIRSHMSILYPHFQSFARFSINSFKTHLNQYDVIHFDVQWCINPADGAEHVVSYIQQNVIDEANVWSKYFRIQHRKLVKVIER